MSRTIPALPFGGETLSSLDPSSSSVVESTSAGTFQTPWSTCCVNVPPGNSASSPIWPVASTFWTRYNVNQQGLPFNPAVNDFHLDFFDGATKVLEVLVSGETSMTFDFRTLQGGGGGVLTHVASITLATSASGPQLFDVGLVAGAAGSLTVAVAGTQQFQVTGLNHSSFAGVTQVVHRAFGDSFGTSAAAGWSMVIWSTLNTIGRFLYHERLDSNSAVNTGWTGGVTNINEIPTNDATPLVAGSAALVSTFFQSNLNLAGDNILGIIGAARTTVAGAGPTHLEITTRVTGANYNSPSIAEDVTFQAAGYAFMTNPATGLQWVPADIAAGAAELGVTSVA